MYCGRHGPRPVTLEHCALCCTLARLCFLFKQYRVCARITGHTLPSFECCAIKRTENITDYISLWDITFLAASSVKMVLSRLMFHTHGSDLSPGVRGFWSPNGSVGSNPTSDMRKFLAMGNVDTRLRLQVADQRVRGLSPSTAKPASFIFGGPRAK